MSRVPRDGCGALTEPRAFAHAMIFGGSGRICRSDNIDFVEISTLCRRIIVVFNRVDVDWLIPARSDGRSWWTVHRVNLVHVWRSLR